MNPIRTIAKNSGASLLAQISAPGSTFVLVFFIARYLGAPGLGKFSSALALLYIFQAICSLGFPYLITRDVAQDKTKAGIYFANASLLGVGFSIIMILTMAAVINFISDNTDVIKAVYVLSLSLIPYVVASVCESICKSFEKLEYVAVSQIAGNTFKIVICLFLLFKGYGLVFLMIGIVCAYLLNSCTSLYLALSLIPKRQLKVDLGFCKWIVTAIPVFAIIFILSSVRWNIDILILAKMLSEREVGFYSAASKLMNIGKLGLGCYIVAIQPVIFRLWNSSREKFTVVCEESMKYLVMLLIPIAVGTTLLSDKIVLLVFKSEFLPAAYALSIIIWILTLSSDNLIFANALVAADYQGINLAGNVLSIVANIGLNLLLIPRLGFIGASIANVLSSVMLFIFQYHYVSRYLFKVNYFRQVKKPFLASGLMGISIILLKEMNLFLVVGVSAIVYLVSLVAVGALNKTDLDLAKGIFKKDAFWQLGDEGRKSKLEKAQI
jgi:O-antigen/teichoic acid export membrane protein